MLSSTYFTWSILEDLHPIYFSGVRLYSTVTEQKLLDHNYNGLKRWKYEMEGSLNKYGLGSFQNVLSQFQARSSNGMARSSLPNGQDETFAQHFQYFSKVMLKSFTCYTGRKKWIFPFRISLVNVKKSTRKCEFAKQNLNGKLHF